MCDAGKASSALLSVWEFMSSFHSSPLDLLTLSAWTSTPVCSSSFSQTPALQIMAELRMRTRGMLELHKVIELQTLSKNATQVPETFQANRRCPELCPFINTA